MKIRDRIKNKNGFTIIETVLSIVIFMLIALALLNMFSSILNMVRNNKATLNANSIVSEQLEVIRGMKFNDVATTSGWGGLIPSTRTLTRGGTEFTVGVDIEWVDDPADLSGDDDALPWDYKRVRVRVSWANPVSGATEEFAASTDIVPEGMEGLSEGTGGISLMIFDAQGIAINEAVVNVDSASLGYSLVGRTTDINGNVWIAELAPADDYHISVTKDGYSMSETYAIDNDPASPNYNPIPEKTHVRVMDQKVAKLGFAIDKLGNLNVKTLHFANPGNLQVNVGTAGEQTDSAMALSPSGQLFVAFADDRDTDSHIYLQKFSYNAGTGAYDRVWASDVRAVNQPVSLSPALKFTPDGSLFLAWEDSRTGDSNIYLQEINVANGNPSGSEFQVSHDVSGSAQKNASLDSDQDGNLYIAWEDYRDVSWDIYSQKFTAATSTLWADDYKVSTSDLNEQMGVRVIVDRDTDAGGANLNNSYIFWQSNHLGSFDIFLSKFDNNHNAVFSEKQLNENGGSLGQYEPAAAYDGSTYFYTAWSDERNSQPDIFMQKIDKNGNRVWAGDYKVNDDSFSTARRGKPSVAYGGDSAIYVTWEDTRNGDAYSDIYSSKIDSNAGRMWTYDLVVSEYLTSLQTNASTLFDAGGKAVTIWQENRNGNMDIFGARYSEMDNLLMAGVDVTVNSVKSKGKYPNPSYDPAFPELGPEYILIPKYSETFTSDNVGGNISITGIEWGSYTFAVDPADYTIISYDLPAPITVNPDSTSSIVLNVDTP